MRIYRRDAQKWKRGRMSGLQICIIAGAGHRCQLGRRRRTCRWSCNNSRSLPGHPAVEPRNIDEFRMALGLVRFLPVGHRHCSRGKVETGHPEHGGVFQRRREHVVKVAIIDRPAERVVQAVAEFAVPDRNMQQIYRGFRFAGEFRKKYECPCSWNTYCAAYCGP